MYGSAGRCSEVRACDLTLEGSGMSRANRLPEVFHDRRSESVRASYIMKI